MRGGVRWLAAALLGASLVCDVVSDAAAMTATLLTDPSLVDHTPGPDLRIGTPDDGVLSDDVGILHSAPNVHGAASYALLSAGPVPVPGFNPEANDYAFVLFVDGTLEFTPDFAASTASEIVVAFTGGSLRSTAEFDHPTRGEATTTIAGGSAHMNPMTGEGQVQWSGSFSQIATPLADEVLTSAPGKGWIVPAPQLGQTGDPYIDDVVTPLLPPDTTALVVVEFTGTVQTDVECCSGFTTLGVLVAYTTEALGCSELPCEGSGGGGGGCATMETCRARVRDALPDETEAPNPKTFRAARKLAKRFAKLEGTLARAATSTDPKQSRLYGKARRQGEALKTTATTLDRKGLLGVPLAALHATIDDLVALIPGA
jgi:hypothetical protein